MAAFVCEDGETVIDRVQVSTLGPRRFMVPGELVLTDRRVVLLVHSAGTQWIWAMMFGMLGGLLAGLLREPATKLTHQIRRDELAAAQVMGKRELRVRSQGEGYAMTFFDVTLGAPDRWAARLQHWAQGSATAQPPPVATLET